MAELTLTLEPTLTEISTAPATSRKMPAYLGGANASPRNTAARSSTSSGVAWSTVATRDTSSRLTAQ